MHSWGDNVRTFLFNCIYWRFQQYFSTLITIVSSTIISRSCVKKVFGYEVKFLCGVNVFQSRCVFLLLNVFKFIMIRMKNYEKYFYLRNSSRICQNKGHFPSSWIMMDDPLITIFDPKAHSNFFKNAYTQLIMK